MLHRKDTPPDAVKVDEPPIQIDGFEGVMLHVGTGLTTTVVEQDDVHPFVPLVTVTV